ncbi:MAG: ADP-ribosylation factor-like protein [Candidatus Hermodarchaeota archaeon]
MDSTLAIIVFGPYESGKSTILNYLQGKFEEDPPPTLGIQEHIIRNTRVREIGGQVKYRELLWPIHIHSEMLYGICVLDVRKRDDFDLYLKFLKEYKDKVDLGNILLVLNKIDRDQNRSPTQYPEYLLELKPFSQLRCGLTGKPIYDGVKNLPKQYALLTSAIPPAVNLFRLSEFIAFRSNINFKSDPGIKLKQSQYPPKEKSEEKPDIRELEEEYGDFLGENK